MSAAEAASLQVNFGIVKCTPRRLHSRSFWPHALALICRRMSSMHKYTRKRGHQTFHFVPYRGERRQICKTQFLHSFCSVP